MSRCFPYPPPGFEPPVDLFNKEKHKEKKHKKDKKEKEKREGKEKHREKDRKDRKDKKEKHKHKKKDKDKEREKDREKSKEKEKTRAPDKTLEDSRFIDELVKRVGDGSQQDTQFTDKREKKPVPVPVPNLVPSAQKTNNEVARSGPTSQKPNYHMNDFAERREKKSVPVPNSVPSVQRKSDEVARLGPTSQTNNPRVNSFSERRVGQLSQEEGVNNAKRTVANAPNPNSKNPNFTNPNFSMQRKSNGPATQGNNHQHTTGFSERKVMAGEMKKPVPVPVPIPVPTSVNSLQAKTNGPTSERENTEVKKFAIDHVVPQIERKIEGPARQTGGEKGDLNWRGSEQDVGKLEGKKEKRKERSEEKQREKELRREEKRQRKEREKEEKRQRKKEKEREKERDKVKEVSLSATIKPCLEGRQRNIEKVRGGLGEISNKRKEVESNGFLHEDEMRTQKLMRMEPQKRKDDFINGFVHVAENDAGSATLNKKLPLYPPPQNGRTNTHHASHTPSPSPPIKPNTNNIAPNSKNTKNTLKTLDNNTAKLEGAVVNKVPQVSNGTVSDAKGVVVNSKKGREDSKPHRDLKYLNVVYSVPKLKEEDLLPQDDEQEWLFGTKRNPNPNPNPNSMRVETSQVWDRAVQIDSVDAIALPYVIPF